MLLLSKSYLLSALFKLDAIARKMECSTAAIRKLPLATLKLLVVVDCVQIRVPQRTATKMRRIMLKLKTVLTDAIVVNKSRVDATMTRIMVQSLIAFVKTRSTGLAEKRAQTWRVTPVSILKIQVVILAPPALT